AETRPVGPADLASLGARCRPDLSARRRGGRVLPQTPITGETAVSRSLPQIYLARHGETAWSLSSQHTGRTDIPLTPRGEQVARVVARLRQLDGDAVLFAHGHVLRVLAARWLGLPPAAGRFFLLGTGALSILGYEHDRLDEPAIRLWNAASKA